MASALDGAFWGESVMRRDRDRLTLKEVLLIIATSTLAGAWLLLLIAPWDVPGSSARRATRQPETPLTEFRANMSDVGARFAAVDWLLDDIERDLTVPSSTRPQTPDARNALPPDPVALVGRLIEARDCLEGAPYAHRHLRYEVLSCRADYLQALAAGWARGEPQQLLSSLQDITLRYAPTPENTEYLACAHRLIGCLHSIQGAPSLARLSLHRAVQDDPADAFGHLAYGVVLEVTADRTRPATGVPTSLTCFEKAVELDPELREAWLRLGLAHEEVGKRRAAVKALRRAAELGCDEAKAALESWGGRAD